MSVEAVFSTTRFIFSGYMCDLFVRGVLIPAHLIEYYRVFRNREGGCTIRTTALTI